MSRKQKSPVKSKHSLTKPSTSTSVTCTRKTSISVKSKVNAVGTCSHASEKPGRKTKMSVCAKKALFSDTINKSNKDLCTVCKKEAPRDDLGMIQCDLCDSWTHVSCIPNDHEYDQSAIICDDVEFYCHICVT